MKRDETGYATVTVAALSAGLSVIALAFMNLSSSRALLDNEIVARLQIDAKLEGALNAEIADIVHRKTSFVDLAAGTTRTFAGERLHLSLENEGDKTNLNFADLTEINRILADLQFDAGLQREVSQTIRRARATGNTPFLSFSDLRANGIDQPVIFCLRKKFTLYQSPRPLSNAAKEGRDSLDGLHLRFKVESEDDSRGLYATVLLTGNSRDPVWVFDFTRYHPNEHTECVHAS